MTMLITVTNMCFAEAKSLVLGHGNKYSMDKDVHAYLVVEIVSVFQRMIGHRQDKTRSKCHMVKKGT